MKGLGKQGQNKFYINELKNHGKTTNYKTQGDSNVIKQKNKRWIRLLQNGRKGFIFHQPFDIFMLTLNMVVHGL